jgi:two-component system sensor histidine kinase KdpD
VLLEKGDAVPAETRRELIASVDAEARRLNRLLANLLDMTRLESGGVTPRREWHSLQELIGTAIGRVEDRLSGRKVELDVPNDLPLVPLDDVLVEQVLFNLLDNALKYSPAGTPISVSARIEDGAAVVTVSDRGPGLPEEDRDRVFDKFYRGRREGQDGGVGLGLAICRGIVRAHGGEIGVADRPGGGVAFRFSLPLGDQTPPVADEAAPERAASGSAGVPAR